MGLLRLVLPLVVALVVPAALPAGAAAFTPPELFWRLRDGDGVWRPLPAARVTRATSIELGMRLQPSPAEYGRQAVAARSAARPPGAQPLPALDSLAQGYCGLRAGTPGTIVTLDRFVAWAGDGVYSVDVSVHDPSAVSAGSVCPAGDPTTRATWTWDTRPALAVYGTPGAHREGRRVRRGGVRLAAGMGAGEIRCALAARLRDGEPRGRVVTRALERGSDDDLFPVAGPWTCAGRATAEWDDPDRDPFTLNGPWGRALAVPVHGDPPRLRLRAGYTAGGRIRLRGRTTGAGPSGREPVEAAAAGGLLTLRLRPVCPRARRREGATVRLRVRRGGLFDTRLRPRLPRGSSTRTYELSARFGGTRWVDAGRVPYLRDFVAITSARRRAGFVRYPLCD